MWNAKTTKSRERYGKQKGPKPGQNGTGTYVSVTLFKAIRKIHRYLLELTPKMWKAKTTKNRKRYGKQKGPKPGQNGTCVSVTQFKAIQKIHLYLPTRTNTKNVWSKDDIKRQERCGKQKGPKLRQNSTYIFITMFKAIQKIHLYLLELTPKMCEAKTT